MVKHHGLAEQKLPGPSFTYGKAESQGEDVAETFLAGQKFGVAEYLMSRGESIYDSAKREPLGKSYVRGHMLHSSTQNPAFEGFGKKTGPVQDGKEVVFPRGVVPDSQGAHKLCEDSW
jgi:hypothetical protein